MEDWKYTFLGRDIIVGCDKSYDNRSGNSSTIFCDWRLPACLHYRLSSFLQLSLLPFHLMPKFELWFIGTGSNYRDIGLKKSQNKSFSFQNWVKCLKIQWHLHSKQQENIIALTASLHQCPEVWVISICLFFNSDIDYEVVAINIPIETVLLLKIFMIHLQHQTNKMVFGSPARS